MKTFDIGIIKDSTRFKENVLPAHADFIPYGSVSEMEAHRGSIKNRVIYDSFLRMNLGGLWKFAYSSSFKSAPAGFEKDDYDERSWDDIRVPSNMQFEGYDEPTYVNTAFPWEGHEDIKPGEVPEVFNPTGSYIRYFNVPSAWDKSWRVGISFQGVESGFALWVNGEYVGYSEDSFTPSEFDITDYLREGENKLAVQVYKWTSSSWLEDQDMFRLSGIYRNVYLFAMPSIHLEDMKIEAVPSDDCKTGTFKATLKTNVSGETGAKVRYSLYEAKDFSNMDSYREASKVIKTGEVKLTKETSFEEVLSDIKLWSAEKPFLYELVLEVCDDKGSVLEVVNQKVGFRKFRMIDGIMCLNGKRIVFRGVNRHEFSCDNGRTPSMEDAWLDLCTMKKNNINAIRTCHYPDDVYLYHLCDELGLYLIAENNMETHGRWNAIISGEIGIEKSLPGDNENYREMMLDRVDSTYHRDKNHPAILIWSLGNESYGGSVIKDMAMRFREHDKERLIHYEGLFWDRRYPESSDMESQMYTSVLGVKKFLEEHPEKPFIMCEYMHAMGNSIGGMFKYNELTETDDRFQGGFIWDYIDQSIRTKNRYGEEYQAYGGDLGRRPCDYNFSGNGIADGTRKPYAKMQEVKKCYQSFRINVVTDEDSDKDNYLAVANEPSNVKAVIFNKNLFAHSSEFDFFFEIAHEGNVLSQTKLDVNIAPLTEEEIDLTEVYNNELQKTLYMKAGADDAFLERTLKDGICELVLTVYVTLKEDKEYADKGYEVAFGQKAVKCKLSGKPSFDFEKEDAALRAKKRFTVTNSHDNVGVRGENFEVLFTKPLGGIASYVYAGKEMLRVAPRPNFWRAPVDNDNGSRDPMRMGMWKTASSFQSKISPNGPNSYCGAKDDGKYPKITEGDGYLEVVFRRYLATYPAATSMEVSYKVFADGTVRVSLDYDKKEGTPDMPEFGFMFFTDADYDRVKWYGMGPCETYCDRTHGGKLSVYENKVAENMEPYLVPQETGNKVGVRWAKVVDLRGRGLIFRGVSDGVQSDDKYASPEGCMEFSALPYTPDQLEEARHAYELPKTNQTVIRCSLKQSGIGGDDTWGAKAHPEFRISGARKLHFAFEFKGI